MQAGNRGDVWGCCCQAVPKSETPGLRDLFFSVSWEHNWKPGCFPLHSVLGFIPSAINPHSPFSWWAQKPPFQRASFPVVLVLLLQREASELYKTNTSGFATWEQPPPDLFLSLRISPAPFHSQVCFSGRSAFLPCSRAQRMPCGGP